MDLAPGKRIRRKLVLERRIGEGGMASVWVANDLARGRRVALKVLAPDFAENTDLVDRFTSEARAMTRIRSPFVPTVYDRGALSDGTPFIVMELMEGVDLDTYLRAHGRMSLRATARLVTRIASALEAAHRIGVVHRDVKPENIFIRGDGDDVEAKLFDFGIAKIPFEGRRTHVGALLGTPAFMSPEQLMSAKDADGRADLWSLGVVAYLALTCRLPFAGQTFGALCVAIHQGTYEAPSRLEPDLPVEVDAWFARALSPTLESRFQTARDLSESLEALVLGCRGNAKAHGLVVLVDDELKSGSGSSVVGVSSGRRVVRARPNRLLLGLTAIGASCVAYAMPPGAGSWLPSRANASWVAVAKLGASAAELRRLAWRNVLAETDDPTKVASSSHPPSDAVTTNGDALPATPTASATVCSAPMPAVAPSATTLPGMSSADFAPDAGTESSTAARQGEGRLSCVGVPGGRDITARGDVAQ